MNNIFYIFLRSTNVILANFSFRMTTPYHTVVLRKESGALSFIDNNCYMLKNCPKEANLLIDKADPYKLAVVNPQNAVTVVPLANDKFIPPPRILAMLTNSIESFRVETGFASNNGPDRTTIALWMENKLGAPRSHEYIIGGPEIAIEFKMNVFKGFDEKSVSPDTVVSASIHPSQIQFRLGSNVGDWVRIEEMFRDSLASPGAKIVWPEGCGIYTR